MHSDRHVHTPYCLHGSSDAMENYVKVAIEAGLESLTFTEQRPFTDGRSASGQGQFDAP